MNKGIKIINLLDVEQNLLYIYTDKNLSECLLGDDKYL